MTMATNASLCPKCGQPYDPSRATYDKNGNLQCDACAIKGQIAVGEERAATSTVSAASGVLGVGLFSIFCFNPFGVMSIVTIIAGASWFMMVGGNQSLRTSMGSKYVPAAIIVVLGILCGVFTLAVMALKMLGIMLGIILLS
jgi:hypothetical protein